MSSYRRSQGADGRQPPVIVGRNSKALKLGAAAADTNHNHANGVGKRRSTVNPQSDTKSAATPAAASSSSRRSGGATSNTTNGTTSRRTTAQSTAFICKADLAQGEIIVHDEDEGQQIRPTDIPGGSSSMPKAKVIAEYVVRSPLGTGTFAHVYALKRIDTKELFAGKTFRREIFTDAETRHAVKTELEVCRSLNHANVVRTFSIFSDPRNTYIIMDLCETGSLDVLLKNRTKLSEPEILYFTRGVLSGLDYLHSTVRVIHRDFKPANIFMNDMMQPKIGDFGLSVPIDITSHYRSKACGTPAFLAPEIIDKKHYDEKIDIWAFGCMFYMMLLGRLPFYEKTSKDTFARISKGEYGPLEFPKNNFQKLAFEFFRKICVLNPGERPGAAALLTQKLLTIYPVPQFLPLDARRGRPEMRQDIRLPNVRKFTTHVAEKPTQQLLLTSAPAAAASLTASTPSVKMPSSSARPTTTSLSVNLDAEHNIVLVKPSTEKLLKFFKCFDRVVGTITIPENQDLYQHEYDDEIVSCYASTSSTSTPTPPTDSSIAAEQPLSSTIAVNGSATQEGEESSASRRMSVDTESEELMNHCVINKLPSAAVSVPNTTTNSTATSSASATATTTPGGAAAAPRRSRGRPRKNPLPPAPLQVAVPPPVPAAPAAAAVTLQPFPSVEIISSATVTNHEPSPPLRRKRGRPSKKSSSTAAAVLNNNNSISVDDAEPMDLSRNISIDTPEKATNNNPKLNAAAVTMLSPRSSSSRASSASRHLPTKYNFYSLHNDLQTKSELFSAQASEFLTQFGELFAEAPPALSEPQQQQLLVFVTHYFHIVTQRSGSGGAATTTMPATSTTTPNHRHASASSNTTSSSTNPLRTPMSSRAEITSEQQQQKNSSSSNTDNSKNLPKLPGDFLMYELSNNSHGLIFPNGMHLLRYKLQLVVEHYTTLHHRTNCLVSQHPQQQQQQSTTTILASKADVSAVNDDTRIIDMQDAVINLTAEAAATASVAAAEAATAAVTETETINDAVSDKTPIAPPRRRSERRITSTKTIPNENEPPHPQQLTSLQSTNSTDSIRKDEKSSSDLPPTLLHPYYYVPDRLVQPLQFLLCCMRLARECRKYPSDMLSNRPTAATSTTTASAASATLNQKQAEFSSSTQQPPPRNTTLARPNTVVMLYDMASLYFGQTTTTTGKNNTNTTAGGDAAGVDPGSSRSTSSSRGGGRSSEHNTTVNGGSPSRRSRKVTMYWLTNDTVQIDFEYDRQSFILLLEYGHLLVPLSALSFRSPPCKDAQAYSAETGGVAGVVQSEPFVPVSLALILGYGCSTRLHDKLLECYSMLDSYTLQRQLATS